ncbi:MarR family transcriptional regulator [Parashewanella curva]|uniref:MarR family transcriptional regulator n=1 Tax=Parashewanella curva TaxID=2338552 RepID=A0A3L8PYR4_9GAMM|nr:MarR family transcriptional regulator [Parashewanella curva]RLV60425.1 MarR family transcriptional regulator [Parashewanella curva]
MTDKQQLTDNVCFAVYSANNAIIRAYRPLLEQYQLTFPQYLVMQALWCEDGISLTELSQATMLDLGTLTPIVKRLESKSLLTKAKNQADERKKVLVLTEQGKGIRLEALSLKQTLLEKVDIPQEELALLKDQCLKIVNDLS